MGVVAIASGGSVETTAGSIRGLKYRFRLVSIQFATRVYELRLRQCTYLQRLGGSLLSRSGSVEIEAPVDWARQPPLPLSFPLTIPGDTPGTLSFSHKGGEIHRWSVQDVFSWFDPFVSVEGVAGLEPYGAVWSWALYVTRTFVFGFGIKVGNCLLLAFIMVGSTINAQAAHSRILGIRINVRRTRKRK
jgi:hypothetical protein